MVNSVRGPSERTRRTSRCFVLLDALVAVIILGVALAGIMGLSAAAVRSQTIGEQLHIASKIADERLELVTALGPEQYRSTFRQTGAAPAPWSNYEWELDIRPAGGRDPYFVSVTVLWSNAGSTRSLTIDTLIAPRLGDDPDPDRRPEETLGGRG